MNSRIKELAKQAGYGQTDDPYVRQAFDVNMFAELLVNDFISMCNEESADYRKHRKDSLTFVDKSIYAEGEAACDILRYKIKQHFGIKE